MVHSRRQLLLSAVAAAGLAGCDRLPFTPTGFKSIDITGANYAQALTLTDHDGRRRSLAEFKGKVLVVFFGYTQCPDVCPTTMVELAAARKLLGADGDRVQGIFVTVDPERDTQELLKNYVTNFGADFIGLYGNAEETAAAAKHFKVYYNKVPGAAPGLYTVDHTAGSYVFDAKGQIRLFTRYGAGPEALAHDLKILLAEG